MTIYENPGLYMIRLVNYQAEKHHARVYSMICMIFNLNLRIPKTKPFRIDVTLSFNNSKKKLYNVNNVIH
jgi:hypothetical protein